MRIALQKKRADSSAGVAQILEMLTALGRARQTPDGRFAGNN